MGGLGSGCTSKAAKIRWRKPSARRHQSLVLKGRKLAPREPAQIPSRLESLVINLAIENVDVLACVRAYDFPRVPNAWILVCVDDEAPDEKRFGDLAAHYDITIHKSHCLRLSKLPGFRLSFVVGWKKRR